MTDISNLDESDIELLDEDELRHAISDILSVRADIRKENQLLYYEPSGPSNEKIHLSEAHTIGAGGGNRSGKTETMLVEIAACATGVFPTKYAEVFKKKFLGPLNVRICIESLTTVLHPILLPKLMWWRWVGSDTQGGPKGHWGWIPRMCLREGSWAKSWSEKLRTLTILCRNPDNLEEVLGESTIQIMCLAGDQRVFMPSGLWREVSGLEKGEFVQTPGNHPAKIKKVFKYEDSNLYRIKCVGGREIIATPEHKHPLADGRLVTTLDLEIGDEIKVMSTENIAARTDGATLDGDNVEEWLLGWTAIAIGDGCLKRKDFGFTAIGESRLLNDLPPLPPNCRMARMPSAKGDYRIWLTKGRRNNPLVTALKGFGLWGKGSEDKFIPGEFFKFPAESRAYFLKHLWNTDGTIYKPGRQAFYATISKCLAYDVKYLLWGLGIYAGVGEVTGLCGFTGKTIKSFRVSVSGGSFDRFMAMYGGEDFAEIDISNKGIHGKVKSIERVLNDDAYCLEIESDDHLFIVDGLLTHNSYDQESPDFASGSFNIILMDEPPKYAIWRENQARVMDVNGRILLSMTWPDDPTIAVDFIYDEVYEPGLPGPMKDPDIDWFVFQTTDNQYINQASISAKSRQWSEELKQVRIFGQPIRFSNRIHPLFTDVANTWCFTCNRACFPEEGKCGCPKASEDLAKYSHVDEFEHPSNWPAIFVLDPHPRKPHMMLWAVVDPADDVYVVASEELDGDPVELKLFIEDIEEEHHLDVKLRLVDPNMAKSAPGVRRGVTWLDEFLDAGLPLELADDSDVGRKRVNTYLRPDMHTHRPRLVFHHRCVKAVTQMKRFVWDNYKKDTEKDEKQTPKQKYDDYPAMLRYLMNWNPDFRDLYEGAPVIQRAGKRHKGY